MSVHTEVPRRQKILPELINIIQSKSPYTEGPSQQTFSPESRQSKHPSAKIQQRNNHSPEHVNIRQLGSPFTEGPEQQTPAPSPEIVKHRKLRSSCKEALRQQILSPQVRNARKLGTPYPEFSLYNISPEPTNVRLSRSSHTEVPRQESLSPEINIRKLQSPHKEISHQMVMSPDPANVYQTRSSNTDVPFQQSLSPDIRQLKRVNSNSSSFDYCAGEVCEDSSCTKQPEYCPKCPICTLNAERKTKEQYKLMKDEYNRICSQESALRSHIALLGAELILMQTKQYHKSPSQMRKFSIDPVEIRRIGSKSSHCNLNTYKQNQNQTIARNTSKLYNQVAHEYAKRHQKTPVAANKLRKHNSAMKVPKVRSSQSESCKQSNSNKIQKLQPAISKSDYDRIPQNLSYMYIEPPKVPPGMAGVCRPPVEFVTYHRLQKMRHEHGYNTGGYVYRSTYTY